MATIKVITLVNLKNHPKGKELEVSAADLAKYPGYYRAMSDVDEETARAVSDRQKTMTSNERHRAIKAELAAEAERLQLMMAEARAATLAADSRLAQEAQERAAADAKAGEIARRAAELEAENERLRLALAARDRLDAKIIELRPAAEATEAGVAGNEPPPPPTQTADKPPHQRKRDA